MIGFLATPGPAQVIIVAVIVLLLFRGELPKGLNRLTAVVAPRRVDHPLTVGVWLRLLASVMLIIAAHFLVNPLVGLVFGAVLFSLVIATTSTPR